jgi:hypothetical protein
LQYLLSQETCSLTWSMTTYAYLVFLISDFRRVLNVICFLLDCSPAYRVQLPMFRNNVSSIFIGEWVQSVNHFIPTCLWRWNRQWSKTLAIKLHMPENNPKENIWHIYFFIHISCCGHCLNVTFSTFIVSI